MSNRASSLLPPSGVAGLVLVNGREQASVSALDRGLAFGDGLFETVRVSNGMLVLKSGHLARLQLGLERLSIAVTTPQIEAQLEQLLSLAAEQDLVDGVIKLIVTRGAGGRGYAPAKNLDPVIISSWHPLPEFPARWYEQGLALAVCKARLPSRPFLAGLKTLNGLDYVLAAAEVQESSLDDGLLLNDTGCVIEATSSNVFVVSDGELLTPMLDTCGVAGVLRQYILEELAAKLAVNARTATLKLDELGGAEEIFICNSVSGIRPVTKLYEERWAIGPVTKKLMEEVTRLFNA